MEGIADNANYIGEQADADELPSARVQLKLMLTAFDRDLAARDRSTYKEAMKDIKKVCKRRDIDDAVVVAPHRDGASLQQNIRELKNSPDLRRFRRRLGNLIRDLGETPEEFEERGR